MHYDDPYPFWHPKAHHLIKFESWQKDSVYIGGHAKARFFLENWKRYDWGSQSFFEAWADAWISGSQPGINHLGTQAELLELHTAMKDEHDCRQSMTTEELEIFDSFNFPLTIYRGVALEKRSHLRPWFASGYSWTTDPNCAAFFANRNNPDHAAILTAVLPCPPVAYFNGRQEREVVIHDGMIEDYEVIWDKGSPSGK